ncbi:MAG TPA: hypothetical protein VFS21_40280 [Roseiflexaceae bacterium]|nr:hypothetical protein [Roseiflexaceae bacterium]
MLSVIGVLFVSVLSLFAPAPVAQVRAAVPVQSVHQAAPAAASLAGSSVAAMLGGRGPIAKAPSAQECTLLDWCPTLEYDLAASDRGQQKVYNAAKPFIGDMGGQAMAGMAVGIITAMILRATRR